MRRCFNCYNFIYILNLKRYNTILNFFNMVLLSIQYQYLVSYRVLVPIPNYRQHKLMKEDEEIKEIINSLVVGVYFSNHNHTYIHNHGD